MVCHRRFGKTVFALRELIDKALKNEKNRPQYAYIAPTFAQAKKVAWEYAKEFTGQVPEMDAYEQELKIVIDRPERGDKIIIYLLGSDNPDSIRGIYLDGAIIDEYAQIAPSLWGEILVPALTDRKGWAIFIGTPKGSNHFKKIYMTAIEDMHKEKLDEKKEHKSIWFGVVLKASQTKVISEEDLLIAKQTTSPEEFAQEFECDWAASMRGAYYDSYMVEAEQAKRITAVPYDRAVPVHTAWDLGIGDATAIWFYQLVGREIHIIDYLEQAGKGLEYYAQELKKKPYLYGTHFLPHDAEAKELGTGKTRIETLREYLGDNPDLRIVKRQSIADGIHAVRMMLNRCYFDAVRTFRGMECLKNYQKVWDEKNQIFKDQPKHDWTSHGADGFRYLALSISSDVDRMNTPRKNYNLQTSSADNGCSAWGF